MPTNTGQFLVILLSHNETKKDQKLVLQINQDKTNKEINKKEISWAKYWTIRAKEEASFLLNKGYEIKKIYIENRTVMSFTIYELQ